MRLTLLFTLSAALLLPACNEEEPDDDEHGTIDQARIDAVLALPGDVAAGETVFATCAISSCHGADGNSGSAGISLSDEVPEHPDDHLISYVLGGTGSMPAQNLTDQQMADVLAYLRDTFG